MWAQGPINSSQIITCFVFSIICTWFRTLDAALLSVNVWLMCVFLWYRIRSTARRWPVMSRRPPPCRRDCRMLYHTTRVCRVSSTKWRGNRLSQTARYCMLIYLTLRHSHTLCVLVFAVSFILCFFDVLILFYLK